MILPQTLVFTSIQTNQECLKSIGHDTRDIYLTLHGKKVRDDEDCIPGRVYRVNYRLPGGKGGFGSMLRALGAQIEKTTNREACRDLSGRRIRDVNTEKKLREWAAKQEERDAEKEKRRREKRKKKHEPQVSQFVDQEYTDQKEKIKQNLEEALKHGLSEPVLAKVKEAGNDYKKMAMCLKSYGVELSSSSSSSSDDDDDAAGDDDDTAAGCSSSFKGDGGGKEKRRRMNEDDGVKNVDASSPSSLDVEEESVRCNALSSKGGDDNDARSSHQSQQGNGETEVISVDNDTGNEATMTSSSIIRPAAATTISTETSSRDDEQEKNNLPPQEPTHTPTQIPTQPTPTQLPIPTPIQPPTPIDITTIDLSTCHSLQHLQALGMEVLKELLKARAVKCSGTLAERAERLLAIKDLTDQEIPAHLLAKGATKGKAKK